MYELIWSGPRLIRRLYGASSSAEYARSVIVAQSDPRYGDVCDVISDFRDCTAYETVSQATEEIAVRDIGARMGNPKVRVAMILPDNEVGRQIREALSLYLSINGETWRVGVVDCMESALRWLRDNPVPPATR